MIKEAFLKGFSKGMASLPKHVQDEIAKQHVREGVGFLSSIPLWAASKVVGKKKVVKAIKAIQKPGIHADTNLGYFADKLMQKSPVGKKLFRMTEHIKSGPNKLDVIERPSITAPLSKATDIAKPIVFGFAAEKALRELKKKREQQAKDKNEQPS